MVDFSGWRWCDLHLEYAAHPCFLCPGKYFVCVLPTKQKKPIKINLLVIVGNKPAKNMLISHLLSTYMKML